MKCKETAMVYSHWFQHKRSLYILIFRTEFFVKLFVSLDRQRLLPLSIHALPNTLFLWGEIF
jgi:hypothetical protein